MIKILFICHGNICRSTMAQSVFADMAQKCGRCGEFDVQSAATSTEEIGSEPHYGTREKLAQEGVPLVPHRAVRMTREDGKKYDLLIGMDAQNIRNMLKIVDDDDAKKICRLLDFTSTPRDIADPWYTGDFTATYNDIRLGCAAILEKI